MSHFNEPHWTDDAATPVFSTRIPLGNTLEMLGSATRMLREIGVPQDRINTLRSDVMDSANYGQACAFIGAWFRVDEVDC